MDLSLDLDRTVVIITGAGGQIGQVIVEGFLSAGSYVAAFDVDTSKFTRQHDRLLWLEVDTTNEDAMCAAWQKVEDHFELPPTVCVAAAALDLSFIKHYSSAALMPVEQFRRTLEVNTIGTFVTAKTWLRRISTTAEPKVEIETKNISLIIIGSEAGVLGAPGNPDYAASKSAVQYGLTLSLAPDAARMNSHARVNAICPGAVDTPQFEKECKEDPAARWMDAEATVASRKPVQATDVARLCLILASDRWSSSTTGQTLRVDAGKTGRLLWGKDGNATW
ncbi:short-chain dehydrogenase reductase sdr [Paramyrothecium foliicola]|nr:short-chain dehydrogenase reductase sdr [Paramyrothecium foliicola]